MPMDRSKVEAIVQEHGPNIANALGLGRWSYVWTIGPINTPVVSTGESSPACCQTDPTYERHRIWIDPENHDDEDDVLESIRHEILHVFDSPFVLYRRTAREAIGGSNHDAWDSLEDIDLHAREQLVLSLERMLDAWGLTPRALSKLGAGGGHEIKPFINTTRRRATSRGTTR